VSRNPRDRSQGVARDLSRTDRDPDQDRVGPIEDVPSGP
jgi:hypothetical protein